ncbi:MAG: ribosome biogenesis GTPase Der [Proteobacteria bacterium]|nr:ribosome biogenesis GTPase Der [Pseudomonadota bacterium]
MSALVAIVGRPNVGKSTLFNRLVGYKKAIVDDQPGVTRDRNYAAVNLSGRSVTLVDTGGFEPDGVEGLAARIREQTVAALEEADLTVFLADGRQGLSPHDRDLADLLRRWGRPFILAVNKIDGPEMETALSEFYELGLEPILPLSAAHGYGLRDFLALIDEMLPPGPDEEAPEGLVRVAVIGRPNVGKSSLINRLVGQERALVADAPGTTRDPVDIEIDHDGRRYRFVDTAGIRRKGRVSYKLEKYAVMRALRSLERSDVALLLIDASEGITDQDAHVAGYALDRGRGLILIFNKWDLIRNKRAELKSIEGRLELKMKFLTFAPNLTASALTGLRVERVFGLVNQVFDQYSIRVSTGQVNRVLEKAVEAHTPPYVGRSRLKFYYGTQASTRPPTFVLFVNRPDKVHFSYQRYLANTFRAAFGLDKTPVRVLLRPRNKSKT